MPWMHGKLIRTGHSHPTTLEKWMSFEHFVFGVSSFDVPPIYHFRFICVRQCLIEIAIGIGIAIELQGESIPIPIAIPIWIMIRHPMGSL
jgi:hypothetical protein